MIHYVDDNKKKAKAYISSEDGELFVSVCIGDEQYDFGLDEKELELISFLIKQGEENRHDRQSKAL